MKTPSPASNSMKLKTLIQSPILRQLCHVFRALSKAKSIAIHLLHKDKTCYQKKNRRGSKKKLYSSIRFHYNWCSSHVLPVTDPVADTHDHGFPASNVYYDSTWNSVVQVEDGGSREEEEPPLSGYPRWLEERQVESSTSAATTDADEIDRLADVFIANFHEKFRLEKQESYRMYQEMLARGM